MSGFSIADFFAQLSIKADTKEVKKIEDSLNKINKSLKMIGVTSVAQAKKVDTVFKGEALRRQHLQVKGLHDELEKMGSSLVGFKNRLVGIDKQSEFVKIKNDIKEAKLEAQRFKNELKLKHNTNSILGKDNIFKKPDAFNGANDKGNNATRMFQGGDDFWERSDKGRRLLHDLSEDQVDQLRALAAEQVKMKKSVTDANLALNTQAKKFRKINDTIPKVNAQITSLTRAQNRLKESARQLALSMVGAFAVFEGVKSINRVGQDFEGMEAAMLASSGSSKLAAKDLAFVDEQAVRLGLDLRETTDAYSKLQFAAKGKMSKGQTKELFTGFSEFATALKVSPEQQKSGLRALQQMLNKTTVMSEELKQQLA